MKRTLPLLPLFLLLCAASAQAQLYKWVGPDGKVTYSDSPPPKSAAHVETKTLTSDGLSTAGLPYELSEAVKNHPVTLYTTTDCAPCSQGRNLLNQRGIPFTEKTVNSKEDVEQLKKMNGDGKLPFLLVGRSKEHGFESSAWNAALSAAGYPETSRLPKSYRNPQAEAAAGEPKPAAAKVANQATKENRSAETTTSELPPATGNAPPGFRF
jgi:glutaredoxin